MHESIELIKRELAAPSLQDLMDRRIVKDRRERRNAVMFGLILIGLLVVGGASILPSGRGEPMQGDQDTNGPIAFVTLDEYQETTGSGIVQPNGTDRRSLDGPPWVDREESIRSGIDSISRLGYFVMWRNGGPIIGNLWTNQAISREQFLGNLPDPRPLAWSPSGNQLLMLIDLEDVPPVDVPMDGASQPRGLFIFDVDDSSLRQIAGPLSPRAFDIAWSPSESEVAYAVDQGDDAGIWITSASGGAPRRIASEAPLFGPMTWAPLENVLVGDQEITRTGAFLGTINEDSWNVVSPDGQHLLYLRADEQSDAFFRSIWVTDSDGSNDRLVVERSDDTAVARWSPDGQRIAYSLHGDIWTIRYDGSDKSRVTDTAEWEAVRGWAPEQPSTSP